MVGVPHLILYAFAQLCLYLLVQGLVDVFKVGRLIGLNIAFASALFSNFWRSRTWWRCWR